MKLNDIDIVNIFFSLLVYLRHNHLKESFIWSSVTLQSIVVPSIMEAESVREPSSNDQAGEGITSLFVRVRVFFGTNCKLSELEYVKIGICQNGNLSELEMVRIRFQILTFHF